MAPHLHANTRSVCLLLFLTSLLLPSKNCIAIGTNNEYCDSNDETCINTKTSTQPVVPINTQTSLKVTNLSTYRVDVYWDDGRYGANIATLEQGNDQTQINTFTGHQFFVTRHGVREGLFDPETDTQHRFVVESLDQEFVIPKTAAPSVNICQDRFSICKGEAERGNCGGSPGWMIVHCCRSCDPYLDASRLIDPKIRCTKENLNITDPTWFPGDLNRLFTSWVVEDRFKQYEPKVWSSPNGEYGGQSGPWVVTFDNFLGDDEAEALIRGGRMSGFDRSTDQGAVSALGEMEKVVSKTRTSSNAWCTGQCESLPEVKAITAKIEELTNVPRENYESFQILEYGPNQFYRRHHDSSGRDTTPPGPRIMTFFLYLTDVEEGGETYFNRLNLAVKPMKGRALVWPSVRDDEPELWDDRMYHEARDVIKGKKYAANHWIHLNDFTGPNKWGCTGSFG